MAGSRASIRDFATHEIECIVGEDGCLGGGTYGVVRLGFHPEHGVVAAKCSQMQGGRKKKKKLDKKIKDEIELLQMADHANVVRVYGWTQWTRSVAIVMEYLPGGNLMDLLTDDDVTLGMRLCARMCCDIADGLAFIHNLTDKRRMVHGDIKAENILLTGELRCKIADFGGAQISAYTGGTTVTASQKPDKIQYTEFYASPEVLRNPSAPMKPSHDTFSFSILVYVILARQMPLVPTMQVYLEGVKSGQRPDMGRINDLKGKHEEQEEDEEVRVIEFLIDLMTSCWRHNATQRPPMRQVSDKLKHFLDEFDEDDIEEEVETSIRDMEIESPSRDEHDFVTIDRFSPPGFDKTDGEGSSQQMTSQSSVDESLPSLPSSPGTPVAPMGQMRLSPPPCRESSEQRRARARLKSISDLLERNEMNRAADECDLLVDVDAKVLAGECENLINETIKVADTLLEKWSFSACLKLTEWCFAVCDNIEELADKLGKLDSCGAVVHAVARALNEINDKREIRENALPLLWKIYQEIRLITANYVKGKSDLDAKQLYYIGYCNLCIGEHEQADEMARPGITLMERDYGEKAPKYCVLARCYDLSGRASLCLGKYRTAAKQFERALEIYASAQDISDKDREETTTTVEEWSKISRGVEWGATQNAKTDATL